MFHVGQLVICVRDDIQRPFDETTPRKGVVYTVRELVQHAEDRVGVKLVEIINAPQFYANGCRECSFTSEAFRPLDDSRLDVFRKALTDAPVDMEPVE